MPTKQKRKTVPKKRAAPPRTSSRRVVLVVDRGWIFAGDASLTKDGYIRLERCLHVFRWESIGFSGMVAAPLDSRVTFKPIVPVEVPPDSIVYRVPVAADWGLKP